MQTACRSTLPGMFFQGFSRVRLILAGRAGSAWPNPTRDIYNLATRPVEFRMPPDPSALDPSRIENPCRSACRVMTRESPVVFSMVGKLLSFLLEFAFAFFAEWGMRQNCLGLIALRVFNW